MYMTPGVSAGGALWPSIACTHFAALASKHIGCVPGVLGSSGMQVQPFLPARTCFIAPLASATIIAALSAIAAGAADSALATGSLAPAVEVVFVSAEAVLLAPV